MASGHVNRANRPNTWPLRPTLQSEDSSCQPGAVHTWPMSVGCLISACEGKADIWEISEVGSGPILLQKSVETSRQA